MIGSSSDISWCNSVWQSGWSRGELPVDDDSWAPPIGELLSRYFVELRDEKHSEGFLEIAMFFAKDTVLVNSGVQKEGRVRYYSPGRSITKPKFSVCAIPTASTLLGLQAMGLCLLMCLHPRYECFGIDRWPIERIG